MATRTARTRKRKSSKKDSWFVDTPVMPAGPPPSLKMGDTIDGRWQILRKLGEGGMGSVWEARHLVNGRKAALKVMLPEVAADPFMRELFEREGRLDNEVDEASYVPRPTGPGAVKVFDSGTLAGSGAPYMVMEMLSGHGLDAIARSQADRRLSPIRTAGIMDSVLHVLEGAHAKGIIHRDLKPENLWMTPTGDVKMLDFGLAKKRGTKDFPKGAIIGTPGYMPPEQAMGLPVGPSADIYSVGATGFKFLTGHPPTAGTYPSCPPPIRSVEPSVPPHLAAVIDRALACESSDRYQSATAMRADLENAVQEELLKGLGG